MIKGLPNNLVIRIKGITYYTLNQFEIDGSVSIDLYRQAEDFNEKVFSFRGAKDEIGLFKELHPIHLNRDDGEAKEGNINYRLIKLAKNLHDEAKEYNRKIKSKIDYTEKPKSTKELTKKTYTMPKRAKKPAFKKGSEEAKAYMSKLRAMRAKGKYQYGATSKLIDSRFSAMKPGKRISRSGDVYYEYRANRSDMDQRPKSKGGTLLGIGSINRAAIEYWQKQLKENLFLKEISKLKSTKKFYTKKIKEIRSQLKKFTNN